MEKELIQKLLECGEMEDEADYALAASNMDKDQADSTSTSSTLPEFCNVCGLPSRADPEPEKRIMYLHAWKYQAKDWSFETELPEWAKEGFPLDDKVSTAMTSTKEETDSSKETGTNVSC